MHGIIRPPEASQPTTAQTSRRRRRARVVAVAIATVVAVLAPMAAVAAVWTQTSSFPVSSSPIGIDVDPATDDIWVVKNSAHTVAKFAPDGTQLLEIGGFGVTPGKFNGASVVAVASNGDIYVTDVGGNRVQQFTSAGTFVRAFGAGGTGPAQFQNPLGIAVDANDNVWVTDVFNGRVQKFSPTGAYLGTLGGGPGAYGPQPYGIDVDPDGNLWITDLNGQTTGSGRVLKVNPTTGAVLFTLTGFGQPVDVTFDGLGQAHVVNFNTREIRTYTLDGTFVDALDVSPGFLKRIAVNGAGQLLATIGSEVRVYDPPGPVDTDGDGIPDGIDADPLNPSTVFLDAAGNTGEVLSNGTGAPLSFVDLPDPSGVKVIVGGTSGQATVRVCGFFTLQIPAGSDLNVTCGSVALEVVSGGPVVVQPDGDGIAQVSVPEGVTALVGTPVDDVFSVEHLGGSGSITVTVDGQATQLAPGDPAADFDANAAPVMDTVTVPSGPVRIDAQPVTASVGYSDVGVDDTHTCAVAWGDGTTSTVPGAGGACDASHQYAAAGVFQVQTTVTDDAGASDQATATVVIYDPDGGFVTGGGWIDSPAGSLAADPAAAGRANFGFVAKYKKGASAPRGITGFRLRQGDFRFRTTSYDWLVVTGTTTATWAGTGVVNGVAGHRFQVWVVDDGTDTFRIRVWTEDAAGAETVVYDNGHAPLRRGNVRIHGAR